MKKHIRINAHEKDQPSLFENHEMGCKTPDGSFYLTLEARLKA